MTAATQPQNVFERFVQLQFETSVGESALEVWSITARITSELSARPVPPRSCFILLLQVISLCEATGWENIARGARGFLRAGE
jgi:hypothetical protein